MKSVPKRLTEAPGGVSNEAPDAATLTQAVLDAGRAAGLAAIGVTTSAVLEPARSLLTQRKEAGYADSMAFTYRNPTRSTDPASTLPSAEAVIAGAWDYRRATPVIDTEGPVGRIARYSWHDHYGDLRQALTKVAEVLTNAGFRAVIKADDNALVDRNVAWRAGLGWYGKNANLLVPGVGSWVVLGAVVTDAPLLPNLNPVADGCGSCRRCFDGCPTDAIVAPGIIDASRCLAWLVQGPDPMPVEFREAMGDRLYGCDDCQDVCPPAKFNDAPVAEADSEIGVDLLWLLAASDDELLDRLGRFYIANRDPNVLRRTALIALGNTADPAEPESVDLGSGVPGIGPSRRMVQQYVDSEDPILAEHARWALDRINHRGRDPKASPVGST